MIRLLIDDQYNSMPWDAIDAIVFDVGNVLLQWTPEEQLNRILKRNGPEMLERFKAVWIPMENRYFEAFAVEEGCIQV